MGQIIEPNVSNIIAGPTVLYLAAAGTAPPSLASIPAASDWLTAGFKPCGYSENGVDFVTTPSVKDFTPDESLAPVKQLVQGLKVEVKIALWESHLENLERAISMSLLSNPGTGIKTLSVGSGNSLKEFALGFQGAGPGGLLARVVNVWRVNVTSPTTQSYQRKDISKLPSTFSALTDSTKAPGRDVYEITDFNAGS